MSPNSGIEIYQRFVRELCENILEKGALKIIVTGDFNAKSSMWDSRLDDRRGDILGLMFSSLELCALNEAGVFTFVRRGGGSTIDITAVSENLLGIVSNWKVLEQEVSMSPHRYIVFSVGSVERNPSVVRWVYRPINKERLANKLTHLVSRSNDITPERLVSILRQSYFATTEKVKTQEGRVPYWWTYEIAALRREVLILRRRVTRLRGNHNREPIAAVEAHTHYIRAKRDLKRAIVNAKKRCWENLVNEVENDVFGDGYKIVTRKLSVNQPSLQLTEEEREVVIDRLFPSVQECIWHKARVREDIPIFSNEELVAAAGKLKSGRAPGRDTVTAEVVKVAVDTIGPYVLAVFNKL